MVTAGRTYKDEVAWRARQTADGIDWGYQGGELELRFKLYFPDKRRRDISNCVKLPEDALATALGFDDCKVARLIVERGETDKENPRCDVTIREVAE